MSCLRKWGLFVMLFACCAASGRAQQRVNALFVGNSYTSANNLPQMVQQVAASMGDQLTWESNTPGGCTFSQHCTNRSMQMVCSGGWDIVVLQEQSQYPSFPQWQVEAAVFPYAKRLVDSIYTHNPCCEPMFYMTWGRKNGDADNATEFPVLATYEGMDSMLCERYTYMAQQNDASLCPVGRVWRYLRSHHPDIELYQGDGSHPSVAGSYAAACAFYVMFFHRDPDSIAFSASLPDSTAQTLRSAVRQVVYENLAQWQRPAPEVSLAVTALDGLTATLSSTPHHADSLTWDFGDGTAITTAATVTTMVHTYADSGRFAASVTAARHCMTATCVADVILAAGTTESIGALPDLGEATVYPNPSHGRVTVALPAGELPSAVAVYGLDGRLVARQTAAELVLDHVPCGEYLLQIECPAGTVTRKIIVCP